MILLAEVHMMPNVMAQLDQIYIEFAEAIEWEGPFALAGDYPALTMINKSAAGPVSKKSATTSRNPRRPHRFKPRQNEQPNCNSIQIIKWDVHSKTRVWRQPYTLP
jgi:hypothetical protein